jgi:nucleoporin NUP42
MSLMVMLNRSYTAILTLIYSETSIKTDMTTEKPVWDLSIYGPAKEEPNMIVGTDLSPEEDRVKYYQYKMQTGNEAQYVSL